MGGPEHRPFLQRLIKISSADQRHFTEIIPYPKWRSCYQYTMFTVLISLQVQLTYHKALVRKRCIWNMNSDILVQNLQSFSFLFCVSLVRLAFL